MRPALLLALIVAAPLLPFACGSGDTGSGASSGMPEGGDGRYHPPGNGMPMSEADACDSLTMAQAARFQHLGCAATTRVCPEFLSAQFGMSCLQYDQGSVQGCLDDYLQQMTCAQMSKAVNDCAVTPLVGTAPKGCP